MNKKIYIIAGEPSGDFIGARLMKSLKSRDNNLIIKGIGGFLMEKQGLKSLFPISHIAIMGIFEIISKIFFIKKLINKTIEDIISFNPDILITIDSPGFNKIVAKKIKSLNKDIKLVHYVAPTVWAWKPKRAKKFAKIYDYMFCLFDFEPPYFEKEGLISYCVGHPIVESKANQGNSLDIISKYDLSNDDTHIVLMPGSRITEIKKLLPIFHQVIENLKKEIPKIKVIIPCVPHLQEKIKTYCTKNNLNDYLLIYDIKDKYDSFKLAKLAIIASGTSSLETSIALIPTIVSYKTNIFTDILTKILVKVQYVSIINIISNKEIIKEFIQGNCKAHLISNYALQILNNTDNNKEQNKKIIINILKKLGYNNFIPSEKASNYILNILKEKKNV